MIRPGKLRTEWLLAAVALIGLAALLWTSAVLILKHERMEQAARVDQGIEHMFTRDAANTAAVYAEAKHIAKFFSEIPAMEGFIRAMAQGGTDPQTGQTLTYWRARMEDNMQAYLASHIEVLQVRLISATPEGRELVRVHRLADETAAIVPDHELQAKGQEAYFSAALQQSGDAVYFSPINLNREHGKIELPPRPVLRAALPVRDASGNVLGIVVVNYSASKLLTAVGTPGDGLADVTEWVTDAAGNYLHHPLPQRAFSHLLAPPGVRWADDFTPQPGQAAAYGLDANAGWALGHMADGKAWLVRTHTLRAQQNSEHGLVLHAGIPLDTLEARAWQASKAALFFLACTFLLTGGILIAAWRVWRRASPDGAPGLMFSSAGKRTDWKIAAAAALLLPVLMWALLTTFLGQPVAHPYILMLIPILLAIALGGFYAGLGATLVAALAGWDLSTHSPALDLGLATVKPETLLGVASLVLAGTLVSFLAEKLRRRGLVLQQFKSTLDSTHDLVHIVDPQTLRITYVNQAMVTALGYTEAELLSMRPLDIVPGMSEAEVLAWIALLASGGRIQALETQFRHKDGHLVLVEVTSTYVAPAGEPARVIAIARDISERKAAEVRILEQAAFLEAIQRNAAVAIIATDTTGLVNAFNPEAERLLGYTAEEIVGQHTPALWHLPDEVMARARDLTETLGREIAPGFEVFTAKVKDGESETREWTFVRKDGSHVVEVLTTSALRDAEGRINGYLGIARDVSEHAAAQAALLAREQQFSAVIEHAPYGVVLVGEDGSIELVNAQFEQDAGYQRQELIGQNVERLVPEPFTSHHQNLHKNFLKTSSARQMAGERVLPVRRKDGSQYLAELHLTPLDATRKTTLVTVANVSQRMAAAAALTDMAQRLERATATGLIGVWEYDFANDTLHTLGETFLARGLTETGWHPWSREEFIASLRPQDRDPFRRRFFPTVTGPVDAESLVTFIALDYAIVRPDGSLLYVEGRGRLEVDADGTAQRLTGTEVDICARTAAEAALAKQTEFLRDALENMEQGFSLMDDKLRLVAWNRRFQTLLDFPDTLMRNGVTLEELFRFNAARGEYGPGDPDTQVRERTELALRFEAHHFERTRPNGTILDIVGRPMPGGGLLTSYTDVTAKHEREANMRESQKLEAIGQLTGGLAHDFNNLLGIIIGNLDLVGETAGLTDKPQRRLQTALDAALRGAEITRSLLAVARRQPLRVQAQDLNAVVREMRPLIESSAGKAVALSLDLCAGELTVPLDAGGLSNALLNLVNNARDAMAQGQTTEPQLTVRTRRLALHGGADAALPAGDYGVLEVLDTGPGMPEAVRERVFEPFYTTKEMGKGTGLGLSMVRGFAEQLGGTARIESEPGAGTTVRIILPV